VALANPFYFLPLDIISDPPPSKGDPPEPPVVRLIDLVDPGGNAPTLPG
jgi:hypothetical protein